MMTGVHYLYNGVHCKRFHLWVSGKLSAPLSQHISLFFCHGVEHLTDNSITVLLQS